MAATVAMLDNLHAVIDAAAAAADHAVKAAGEIDRSRGDFRESVFLPITSGGIWDGTGQPEASTVVRVHERAQETAGIRLRQIDGALETFGMALRYAAGRYDTFKLSLPSQFHVGDNGTISGHTGVMSGADGPEASYQAELKEILGLVDTADAALIERLNALMDDPMPVLTTAATPGILDAAGEAYLAAHEDGVAPRWNEDWTIEGKTRAGTQAEWEAALGSAACYYDGGGFMQGPDGRWYPIATPRMLVDGETETSYGHGYLANDVGGLDEGWQTIDTHMGFGMLQDPESGAVKGTIAIGVLAGGSYNPVTSVDPRATAGIQVGADGYPVAAGDPTDAPMSRPPDVPYGDPNKPDLPGSKRIAVATQGLEALNAMEQVDNDKYYTYRAEFQQNTDGRTRVVLTAYQVVNGPDGQYAVPYDAHVGADGQVVTERARWNEPPGSYGTDSVDQGSTIPVKEAG
ncbi:MAG: hypothetical protein GEV10_03745 [Streptosporangiales bacterium]|nr:hypothetical protein [Streptosporangiales bacterium]